MRTFKKIFLSLFFLAACFMVKANHGKEGKTEPVLHGSVLDGDTKKPLQGVVISITSAKILGEKEVTTDALGNFKIPQLPAGEVTIVVEKKGYKTYRREGVVVKEGMSLKLNFDIEETEKDESEVFHPMRRMIEG